MEMSVMALALQSLVSMLLLRVDTQAYLEVGGYSVGHWTERVAISVEGIPFWADMSTPCMLAESQPNPFLTALFQIIKINQANWVLISR